MITSQQCFAEYGAPDIVFERKWMTLLIVPQEIGVKIQPLPRRIYCNKDMIAPLDTALRNLIEQGCSEELRTWDGCFNIRPKKLNPKALSLHSWGIAVDINAAWNQLRQKPTLTPGFVKCWKDAGFDWGGDWKIPDGMHFQLSDI